VNREWLIVIDYSQRNKRKPEHGGAELKRGGGEKLFTTEWKESRSRWRITQTQTRVWIYWSAFSEDACGLKVDIVWRGTFLTKTQNLINNRANPYVGNLQRKVKKHVTQMHVYMWLPVLPERRVDYMPLCSAEMTALRCIEFNAPVVLCCVVLDTGDTSPIFFVPHLLVTNQNNL
jgi:hypothetical protein